MVSEVKMYGDIKQELVHLQRPRQWKNTSCGLSTHSLLSAPMLPLQEGRVYCTDGHVINWKACKVCYPPS